MRSLLTAILHLFLPPSGVHRASPTLTPTSPPLPPRPVKPPLPVVLADNQPLVRPYVTLWERERDELDRRRLQRERRRAAVLATMGQDYAVPLEVAV
ncbi:hypothetical protein [Streptomyces sp. CoH27]|uniref:hypothetical protein n=1 Tax=Streptomyces sp. CoH27 TaxID=2875763 RepID=UPI001CD6D268|nr:hypothetical protein [Streptomyces sp. CoH27]